MKKKAVSITSSVMILASRESPMVVAVNLLLSGSLIPARQPLPVASLPARVLTSALIPLTISLSLSGRTPNQLIPLRLAAFPFKSCSVGGSVRQ